MEQKRSQNKNEVPHGRSRRAIVPSESRFQCLGSIKAWAEQVCRKARKLSKSEDTDSNTPKSALTIRELTLQSSPQILLTLLSFYEVKEAQRSCIETEAQTTNALSHRVKDAETFDRHRWNKLRVIGTTMVAR